MKDDSPESASKHIEIELGKEMLSLIDHLYAAKDAAGLRLLHGALAELTLQGVMDKTTSFIDLADYCVTLTEALGGSPDAAEQAEGHRKLIDEDFKTAN